MDLKTVTAKLEKIYPLKLAEKWDNVGLLVEPTKSREIKKVFLTIDLTENVLEEALAQNADFICSYHPPIFSAFKRFHLNIFISLASRLNTKNTKDRIILRAIEEKVAIYSPHSSVDAAEGGVTDW